MKRYSLAYSTRGAVRALLHRARRGNNTHTHTPPAHSGTAHYCNAERKFKAVMKPSRCRGCSLSSRGRRAKVRDDAPRTAAARKKLTTAWLLRPPCLAPTRLA